MGRKNVNRVLWCEHRTSLNFAEYWLGLDILPVAKKTPTVWFDGNTSPYRYWAFGDPNHRNSRCISYRKNGFNDRYCGNKYRYTCKKAAGTVHLL